MDCKFKYNPEDFSSNRFALARQGEMLFFTIKHRLVEGAISADTAFELRGYMEELLYD